MINTDSSLQIVYKPSTTLFTSGFIQKDFGKLIIKFPNLPSIYDPLLPLTGIKCFIPDNLGVKHQQTCHSYPRVGWIVFEKLTAVNIFIIIFCFKKKIQF